MTKPNLFDAIHALVGGELSGSNTYNSYIYHDGQSPPTEEAIQTKLASMISDWEAQEYARNRVSEYPSQGDQMDMIYKDNKNSTTTHADAVEAVKTKWPKDNSGPV